LATYRSDNFSESNCGNGMGVAVSEVENGNNYPPYLLTYLFHAAEYFFRSQPVLS
jgi:hypothetical protein